ncbi:hypothetical protein T10_9531 [Trichinella papuae]|uniref:Uncharacterized protein n=1 Tax=Trichinella papuae TaxID=268474 RepID=A0A0V1N4P6_9BILA|nr:hypothetical protein T10_9531 [Trichinella papuae]
MDKQIDKCPTSMINFAPQTLCLRNELISLGRIREGFAFPKGTSKTALSGKSKNCQRLIKLSTSNNNKNN